MITKKMVRGHFVPINTNIFPARMSNIPALQITTAKLNGAMVQFLYRGVSEELYQRLGGRLSPKRPNEKFSSYARAGQSHAACGSGVQCGESDLNSVILHQWNQAGIPTSGISASPLAERARFYALRGGQIDRGYVFKLSFDHLMKARVAIYKVNELVPHPAMPEDDEHVLVASDFGSIPESAIVSIEEVIGRSLCGKECNF